MTGIFLSYSRVDRPITESLASHLRRTYGHEHVWFDENLRAGQDWWREIVTQIDRCDVFLLLISPESLDSKYCMMELDEARKRNKHILPIRVRARTQVPAHIKSLHMINMDSGITADSITDLQAAINHVRKPAKPDTQKTRAARPAAVTRPSLMSLVTTRPNAVVAGPVGVSVPVPASARATQTAEIAAVVSASIPWRWITVATLLMVMMVATLPFVVRRGGTTSTSAAPAPTALSVQLVMSSDTPTSPAAVVTATDQTAAVPAGLTLVYDAQSLVLVNLGDRPLSASGLTFQQGDSVYTSNTWADGQALGNLGAGECVQVWTTATRYLNAPDVCAKRLRWRQSSRPYWFWLGNDGATFDVIRNGAVIARCPVNGGQCAIPTR